ncbi:phage virion morphogenesis protein [Thioalkalivibrio sp. ALMg9]|uniref:phage virion morphogenesis protein n=1 Tax=Thioalkalivibrio sp. ALMg9 TaxID=1266912 RepID=UPI0003760619|nr:phage virion morphogenesis protein [Thioalkalivibrio sp. ALMg9]
MAGVNVRYEIRDDRVRRALEALGRRAARMDAPLRAIGEDLQLSHRDRFDQQISPEGHPWAPLSPEYQERKARRADEVLVLNTYLRDTLRYDVAAGRLEFGTDRVYGATHQFGDDARGIPARPWLGLSDADEQSAVRTLLDYLERPLRGGRGPSQ